MQKENAVSKLKEAIELALPIYRAGGTTRAWASTATPMQVAEALAELEAKAERYNAMLTEALESLRGAESRAAVMDAGAATPFMWGLMTAEGLPFYDECCVGEEAVVQEVATTYNSMADDADHITPVKLFLLQAEPTAFISESGLKLLGAGVGVTIYPEPQLAAEEHQETLPLFLGQPE